jgi:hypothetical protein
MDEISDAERASLKVARARTVEYAAGKDVDRERLLKMRSGCKNRWSLTVVSADDAELLGTLRRIISMEPPGLFA